MKFLALMKFILMFGAVLFALLFLGSCDTSRVTALDITNSDYLADFRYVLSVDHMGLILRMPKGEAWGTLTINGKTYEECWDNFQIEDYIYYTIDNDFVHDTDTFESVTNYTLSKNGKTYSGRIITPGVPMMQLPAFDINEDYRFEWDADPKPMYFLINIYYLDDTPDEYVQLSGHKRSYTVSKTPWVDQNYFAFIVGMSSLNYKVHSNELLVLKSSGRISNWVRPPE